MPRPLLFRSQNLPYHVRARSNNREWFYLPIAQVWEIITEHLRETIQDYQIQVHAFVLMSNHFHALVTTPLQNLDKAMHHLLRETSRDINLRASRINHVFGGPYKWSVITNRRYYEHAFRYVCQNPVKAEICKRVEEYPFSTLFTGYRGVNSPLPLVESIFDRQSVLDLNLSQKIEWLNIRYSPEENDCIKKALHHSEFRFRENNLTLNIRHRLENPEQATQLALFS